MVDSEEQARVFIIQVRLPFVVNNTEITRQSHLNIHVNIVTIVELEMLSSLTEFNQSINKMTSD